MPTLWAHGFYWVDQTVSTVVIPPVISKGGYPSWQASVTMGSLFGALSSALSDAWSAWLGWYRLFRRVRTLPASQKAVLLYTLETLESPLYSQARAAVRATATTLNFNHPDQWVTYGRALKSNRKRAENLYRHLRACEIMETRWQALHGGSTLARLSNPVQHYTVELAYQEYARAPWGDR